MARQHISTGSPFERNIGYCRAVVVDGWIFVAGTTGYNYDTMVMPDSVEEQCQNALNTIAKALAEAGASLDDTVRVNYILPNAEDFPACWPITSKAFAKALPASTMISAGLANDTMKIEIEVTARQPEHARG